MSKEHEASARFKADREKRVVVGVGEPLPGAVPSVILGMPPAAWDAMANGKTHTFDLTKVGIPVQIMMFRGDSYEHTVEVMQSGAVAAGAEFIDHRKPSPDLGIDKPSEH